MDLNRSQVEEAGGLGSGKYCHTAKTVANC